MGRDKRSQQHKNRKKQSKPKNQIYVQKYSKEELILEAYTVQQLLKNSQQNIKNNAFQYIYLLSNEWLWDWEDFVGYNDIIQGQEPQSKYFSIDHPGPVNKDLSTKFIDEFLEVPLELSDQYGYLNHYLYFNFKNQDVKFVDEECFNFFNTKYPGHEFRRPVMTINNKPKYIRKLIRPNIIFFHDGLVEKIQSMSENDLKKDENPLQNFRLQLNPYWKYQELEEFLLKFQGINLKINPKNLEIRIWKIDQSLTKKQLQNGFTSSITLKKYNIKGNLLEQNQKELFLKQYIKDEYTFCVEIKLKDKEKWSLTASMKPIGPLLDPKTNKPQEAKCEFDGEVTILAGKCLCSQVFYCDQQCRYNDQKFHYQSCKQAYDSEDDEEFDKMEVTNPGIQGLANIGNTCYLNSALQCIINTPYISKLFSTNLHQFQLKSQLKQHNFLAQKFSKLIKKIKIADQQILMPRALKSQIALYNSQFKYTDQQDAQEFLSTLLDALNELFLPRNQLKIQQDQLEIENLKIKEESKEESQNQEYQEVLKIWKEQYEINYSNFLLSTFLGLFKSVITCPACFYQSTSYEPFTLVSLPIKYKPVVKGYTIYIVRYDMYLPIESQFVEYDPDNDTLLKLIQKVAKLQNLDDQKLLPVISTQERITNFYMNPEKNQASIVQKDLQMHSKRYFVLYELEQNLSSITHLDKVITLEFLQNQPIRGMNEYSQQTPASIPRVIVINLMTSVSMIYSIVLNLFKQDYQKEINQLQLFLEEEYQNQIIENQDQNNQSDKIKEMINNFPFKIFILSQKKQSKKYKNVCYFCDKKCNKCPLPFKQFHTFQDFLGEYNLQFDLEIFWESDQTPKILMKHDFSNNKFKDSLEYINPVIQQKKQKDTSIPTIDECLEAFQEPEILSEDNAWYCSSCKEHQKAYKTMRIFFSPKYLILQIKRFIKDQSGDRVKNSTQVLFNEELNLQPLAVGFNPSLSQNNKLLDYQLYAIIVHEGTIDQGHYLSYCKSDGEWYEYNDDLVTPVALEQVINNKNAYLLFYQLKEQ